MLNYILAKLLCAAPLKYLTLPLVIVDGPSPLAPVLHDTPLLAHSFPKFFFYLCPDVCHYMLGCDNNC